jgi:hypothetical protein
MSYKLYGKEIFYVVETTIREYAWIKRVNSTTSPYTESSKSTGSKESDIDKLTSKFEELSGIYSLDKKRVFERDQARAFHIISMSLGEDDKRTRDKYKLDIFESQVLKGEPIHSTYVYDKNPDLSFEGRKEYRCFLRQTRRISPQGDCSRL